MQKNKNFSNDKPQKDEEFHSSKNEFLKTIFQSRKKSYEQKIINLVQLNKKESSKQQFSKLAIHKQFVILYDPLEDENKITKRENDHQQQKKKIKDKPFKKNRSSLNQKPFVEIYQAKNHQLQLEYELYNQELRKKVPNPGPGAYNISKPLIEPVYQTIVKNENIVLVKLNSNDGTANFKSNNRKLNSIYDKQKMQNPGPGDYVLDTDEIRKKRKQKVKSKLEEYAKNYESNYRFIFEVFNSQHQSIQSIPNKKVFATYNGTEYNGAHAKINQPQYIPRQIFQKGQRSKSINKDQKLLINHKFQRQRSLSELLKIQEKQKEQQSIFAFKTIDYESIKLKNIQKMKIKPQFSEAFNGNFNIQKDIKFDIELKEKIKLLFEFNQEKVNDHKSIKNNYLHQKIGYYDGTQKQKIFTKNHMKTVKNHKIVKKLLQPLPNGQKRYESLDLPQKSYKLKDQKNLTKSRYDQNMMDLLFNKNILKNSKFPNLAHPRVYSKIDSLQPKKISYSTIQNY